MFLSKFGPAGGVNRPRFDDIPILAALGNDPSLRIGSIEVRHGKRIDALKVLYIHSNGADSTLTEQHGGNGSPPELFDMRPGEILTGVRGTLVVHNGSIRVASLEFITNMPRMPRVFGVASGEGRHLYEFIAPPGAEILGFFGNAAGVDDSELDALGVILRSA